MRIHLSPLTFAFCQCTKKGRDRGLSLDGSSRSYCSRKCAASNGARLVKDPVGKFLCQFCDKACASDQALKTHIGMTHKLQKAAAMAANENLDKLLAFQERTAAAVTREALSSAAAVTKEALSSTFASNETLSSALALTVATVERHERHATQAPAEGQGLVAVATAQASSTEALNAAFASGERHAIQASAEEKELSLAVAFKIQYDGILCRISIPDDVFTYEAL
jgi:hypothetical protein